MTDNLSSITVLGDLAKPMDTLILKVSEAIGGGLAPWQTIRMANATAKADLIKANSEIQIADLQRRAAERVVYEESLKQLNIEQITEKAEPHLQPDTDARKMENDWVTNFFDKARLISDENAQEMWAKVLAGEANSPGSYSKRTIEILSNLDKSDAELFALLLSTSCKLRYNQPLIFDFEEQIYKRNGIDFNALSHLDDIGLINFSNLTEYVKFADGPKIEIVIGAEKILLELSEAERFQFDIGKALPTKAGKEIGNLVNVAGPPLELVPYLLSGPWKKYSASLVGAQTMSSS